MIITILGSKEFDSLEYHLFDSFKFLGNEVFHIDIKDIIPIPYKYNYFASKFFKYYDEFLFKNAAKLIIDTNPELVVCTYRFINPICIDIIKKALPNTKVIHVNPDALTTFEYQQIFASSYDAYFTKDPYIVSFMRNKMDIKNTFYLPEAFNPRVHSTDSANREYLEKKIKIDVVAFGTMYPYRANMVSILNNKGINISLFGTPDKRFPKDEITSNFKNEYITGERKAEVLLGSKIVFNNFHYAEIESANVKFFEIAGIGGFQICDYKPVLKEYSKIDVEKFTFKTIDEAYELINYYLDKPQLRYDLANEQRIHFIENHTYEHRVQQLLNLL